MKYFVLVMLMCAGPALAETDTVPPLTSDLLPLPAEMSVMSVGNITSEDLGKVTASDLAKTPAQPLPKGESVLELSE